MSKIKTLLKYDKDNADKQDVKQFVTDGQLTTVIKFLSAFKKK